MSAVGELVQGERRGRWLVAAVACMAAMAWAAAPARAADTRSPGSPLTIYANDNGQLQVASPAAPPASSSRRRWQPANAGLNIAQTAGGTTPARRLRLPGTTFMPDTPPAVTGNGSAEHPWTLTTSYPLARPVPIRRPRRGELTYVNGTTDVGLQLHRGRTTADTSRPARPRLRGRRPLRRRQRRRRGLPRLQARRARSAESTRRRGAPRARRAAPWSDHYQEASYSDVFGVVGDASTPGSTTRRPDAARQRRRRAVEHRQPGAGTPARRSRSSGASAASSPSTSPSPARQGHRARSRR